MTTKRLTGSPNRDVVRRIEAFNAHRDPKLLERKYHLMREHAYAFFRGTAHLFWEDWAADRPRFADAPIVWSCGDAHLENFGSFLGDNRLVYFDLNDFDEAGLAPSTADVARLLTSVHVACREVGLSAPDTTALCSELLDAYCAAIVEGKARWVERDIARGMVRDLLQSAQDRSLVDLLSERTIMDRGRRLIRIDGTRAAKIPALERSTIKDGVQRACDTHSMHGDTRGFYEVLDVAARGAGLSSIGLRRYVMLVRGYGDDDRANSLLDLKEARPSSMVANLAVTQPRWTSEADRIVTIQQRMQGISPARLSALSIGRVKYVLRDLQPTEDRFRLADWNGKVGRLRRLAATMGQLLAWAQLRATGRGGAAAADALIEFGRDRSWVRPLVDYARRYAERSSEDWREFVGKI